jgi:hypothetical protein
MPTTRSGIYALTRLLLEVEDDQVHEGLDVEEPRKILRPQTRLDLAGIHLRHGLADHLERLVGEHPAAHPSPDLLSRPRLDAAPRDADPERSLEAEHDVEEIDRFGAEIREDPGVAADLLGIHLECFRKAGAYLVEDLPFRLHVGPPRGQHAVK